MAETKPEPKAGDLCPQCGGTFVEHRAPTDAERKRAEDRETSGVYPPRVDSAPAGVREALGPLMQCTGCGYKTRIRPEEHDDDKPRRGKKAETAAAAGASKE
jgi:hypothetical protein